MNFNFCNDEEYNLRNEAYRRQGMVFPYQPAFVDTYNSRANSIDTLSKEKHLTILDDSQKRYFTKDKKKMGKWTSEEDEILKELVLNYGGKCWKKIAEHIKGRTEIQCLHRWTKILQPGLVKGPWTIDEDRQLVSWISKFGPKKWSQCSQYIKGRSDKQCRERWFNCLNPKVKKGNWSAEEDYKIFFLFKKIGSKWAHIANYFQGRSENSVKNRFYSTLRRYVTEQKKSQGMKRKRNSDQVELLKETLSPNIQKPSGVPKEDLMKYFDISFSEAKEKFLLEQKFTDKELRLYNSQIEKKIESENFETNNNNNYNNLSIINNNNSLNINNDKIDTKSQSSFGDNNTLLKSNLNNLNFDLCNGLNSPSQSGTLKLDANDSSLNRENAQNFYKSMDIYSLERNISEMCDDNDMFFQDPQLGNFDNYIDNMMEGIFKNMNDTSSFDNLVKFSSGDAAMNYEDLSRNNMDDVLDLFSGESSGRPGSATAESLNNSDSISLGIINRNVNQVRLCNDGESSNSSNVSEDSPSYENPIDCGVNTKSEVFHSLYDQLNDLEKLIKSAKRELIKYEKKNGKK